ncbi:MAG: response regulator [Chloroflexi bacterium]|nr:response regulator [Chloroflexota bacterium]
MPQTGPAHANDRPSSGHLVDETVGFVNESFVHELRSALHYLYDWQRLLHSPLVSALGLDAQQDPSLALRRSLLDGIESLKPDVTVPPKSRAWRAYRLLHSRFTEQFTQGEVTRELGLSIRHLRREETAAIQHLAAHLWSRHGLDSKWTAQRGVPEEKSDVRAASGVSLTPRDELERLHEAVPPESVLLGEIVRSSVAIADSLTEENAVRIEVAEAAGRVQVTGQRTSVSQALTTVLTMAVQRLATGKVSVHWYTAAGRVVTRVTAEGEGATADLSSDEIERLDMARHLLGLSGGTLRAEVAPDTNGVFSALITLPGSEKVPLLVIDDNADALQLFERYLSDTWYEFTGTRDPQEAVSLAERMCTRLIVLDVMLPGVSGWELLGRLREHPVTTEVPIVVCTILPEEQLALDLGAAAFIRKPFTRQMLLATLDCHAQLPQTETS